jgi:MoxR-like ATPase
MSGEAAGDDLDSSSATPQRMQHSGIQTTEPSGKPDQAGYEAAQRLLENIETVVRGKREEIRLVLAALISGGHVLFEDVPGTAKTVLARAIAGSIAGAVPSRIQCTPDLQPTDVTGLSVFNQELRRFEFQPGPLFANIVLVDEVNRAMPKTQSALLEAMAEHQVTVDGITRRLPELFLLLATENPIEYEGTFPLPEAQLDRFFVRASLGYPGEEEELAVVRSQQHGHPLDALEPVITDGELADARLACEDVYVDELLDRWLVQLVRTTRARPEVEVGASVRGSLALIKVARAWALLHGRSYVTPEDVEHLFLPVLGHRLVFSTSFIAETRELTRDEALEQVKAHCLELVPPPRPAWASGSADGEWARPGAGAARAD